MPKINLCSPKEKFLYGVTSVDGFIKLPVKPLIDCALIRWPKLSSALTQLIERARRTEINISSIIFILCKSDAGFIECCINNAYIGRTRFETISRREEREYSLYSSDEQHRNWPNMFSPKGWMLLCCNFVTHRSNTLGILALRSLFRYKIISANVSIIYA